MVFAIYWYESAMGVHTSPILNTPPNSLPIPFLRWDAPSLSTQSHASNLDWKSISHMKIYMLQCYSLKSSHPHLLPQSPKVCSLHLCLFCCLTHRVIITVFLNSIYRYICFNILYWCFPFWLISLCIIGSSFTHLIRIGSNSYTLTIRKQKEKLRKQFHSPMQQKE